jgi:hypothetical protein
VKYRGRRTESGVEVIAEDDQEFKFQVIAGYQGRAGS